MKPYPTALMDDADRELMALRLDRLCVERDEAELRGDAVSVQEQIHLALAECTARGWLASFRMGDGWRVTERGGAEALKPTPPEADLPAMTEPLSAQVADHMRKLTAELREAQRRIADLEAGMRRMQDEAAAKGVEIAIPTPSASS